MAASHETLYVRDFSGGLNLTDQVQDIRPNESPDCLNVDFGVRGGFVLRGGFQKVTTQALLYQAQFLGPTYYGADVVLIANSSGALCTWDGTTYTTTANTITDALATARVEMAPFSFQLSGTAYSRAYMVNARAAGVLKCRTWDGTTFTTLGTAFNDVYTAPSLGNMPLSRHITAHQGYMWVADTTEAGIRYPHRVRFSHLGVPESWATADYFDVDPGDDGDPVTALVPFKDSLLVFKQTSVWIVYGYDRTSFVVQRVSGAAGVGNNAAVDASPSTCYWFATDGRFMSFNGSQVEVLSRQIEWWVDTNRIFAGSTSNQVRWLDGRVYLSLKAGPAESVSKWLFVFDPIPRTFTRYDKQVQDMLYWIKVNQEPDPLFLFSNDSTGTMTRYDRATSVDTDNTGANVRIDGYYCTSWLTAGETATRKRWKRPRVTAASDTTATITTDVFQDFDSSNSARNSQFTISVAGGAVWGTAVWGTAFWTAGLQDYYKFARLTSSGTAFAIQYKFSSTDNSGRWWVDSIAVPFRRKAVK